MGLSLTVDVRPQLTMLSDLEEVIPEGLDLGLREAAEIGSDWIDERLNQVLRKQTPYYRLQINAKPFGEGWSINDAGVVYGPWLEGVSRRNQTTRFKGYRTFRETRQRLEREAYVFVERHIMDAVKRVTR